MLKAIRVLSRLTFVLGWSCAAKASTPQLKVWTTHSTSVFAPKGCPRPLAASRPQDVINIDV